MTILEWILLSIILIVVIPILIYLSTKFGTVGFYRGREISKEKEMNKIDNTEEKVVDN